MTREERIAWLQAHGCKLEPSTGRDFGIVLRVEDDRQICGARTNHGTPCKKSPVPGRNRCRLHGGKNPRGTDSPHFVHGRKSKFLPENLADRYIEAIGDPGLLSLRDDIAIADAMLTNVLQEMQPGTSQWADAAALCKKLEKQVADGDKVGTNASIKALGAALASGLEQSAMVDRYFALLAKKRASVESERRYLIEQGQMITLAELFNLIGAISAAIRSVVPEGEQRTRLIEHINTQVGL